MTYIKQAGAIEEALKTVADKMELHKHPFETIFSTMLPAIVWPASRLLSAFWLIAEAVGYGPSLLGEYIDEKLGFHSGNPDLSDSNLKNAASSFTNKVFNTIGMSAESDMDIFLQKESVSMNDLVALAVLIKNRPLKKEAAPGRASLLKNFINKVFKGQRLGLMNILFFMLKSFAKGLLMLGVAKGGVEFIKEKALGPKTDIYEDDPSQLRLLNPTNNLMSGKLIPYANVFGNIEDSLIEHLKDIKINYDGDRYPLPEYFEKEKSRPLKGSPEMKDLFEEKILPYNKVLTDPVFIAPKIQDLGKFILPHMVIANLIGTKKCIYK